MPQDEPTPTDPPPTDPTPDPAPTDPPPEEEPETFPRAYVEQLRQESAGHRQRAARADEATTRLLDASIRQATAGILADPTDLPHADGLLDDDGWPDPERIATAARDLVTRKPHLGDRRPAGDIDQGARTDPTAPVSLHRLLRDRA